MEKTVTDPTMKAKLQEYLDAASAKDPALASVYDRGKMEECCEYICGQVRELYIKSHGRKDGGTGFAAEEIYKMARDFFIEGHSAKKTAKINEKDDGADDESGKSENAVQEPQKAKETESMQMDLFAAGVDGV